ncbi:MAG: T9SS type A sorting domain-containing protein, partial [Ignavibacteriaceae bacterium]
RDLFTVIALNRVSWFGDVNSDGFIDILDLIMVVDHIVSVDSLNSNELTRADIAPWLQGNPSPNPDGFVNVQDLSLIQNIILTGIYPNGVSIGNFDHQSLPKSNGNEDAKVSLYVTKKGIEVYFDSEVGIRGAQIEFANVKNDPGTIVINTDLGQGFYYYQNDVKILRTLLYDPLGEKYIESGQHLIASIPFSLTEPDKVTLEKIVLVDLSRQKLENIQVEIVYGNPPSVPSEYTLNQNYPNPFNPGTTIEFSLPDDVSNVKLSIYNVLGEKVAELVNTALTAGNYQYQWNANNFASGMYLYELRTDKFVAVKKMLLLK